MTAAWLIWDAVLFPLCFTLCWLLRRNNRVRDFRLSLIGDISQAADDDIFSGRPWRWRYDVLESVTYERMMFSCKPLAPERFYTDTAFLQVSDHA